MRKLYIANKNYSSWSLRPWVLMRELGFDFDEVLVPFEADSWKSFRAFSPNGRVPCLVDGALTVWDSLAIAEYLAEQNPRVWPAGREARAYARSVAAEMHSGLEALRARCTFNAGLRIRLESRPKALLRDIARVDEIFATGLERFGGPFLAGDGFTAADAFFAPVAFRVQTYGLELSAPSAAYVERLLALPSMREWYEAGLAEPWREAGHEEDARTMGVITADLRHSAT
ncbi:glutathione S-transferase family protein [Aureimonas mangrovi]|uniref:glutathione S-transferase family protein n=1 Tax=Aureimonas mangrovi TaxID=2758041 RepID=UPI00163D53A8|nr:glutathione S-transferase family protein [Aureimonas mangrovi]